MVLKSQGRLLNLLANIRLRFKGMTGTNTQAYSDTDLIMAFKSFIVNSIWPKWNSTVRVGSQVSKQILGYG